MPHSPPFVAEVLPLQDLRRDVAEDDDAVAERGGAGELEPQPGDIDAVKETGAASDGDGEDRKVELIDEVVLDQRAIELAGPVLHDVLARLLFQLGDFLSNITFDEPGIPRGLPQSRRGDEFGEAVDPVEVVVTSDL